jgi:hypothetical protein
LIEKPNHPDGDAELDGTSSAHTDSAPGTAGVTIE